MRSSRVSFFWHFCSCCCLAVSTSFRSFSLCFLSFSEVAMSLVRSARSDLALRRPLERMLMASVVLETSDDATLSKSFLYFLMALSSSSNLASPWTIILAASRHCPRRLWPWPLTASCRSDAGSTWDLSAFAVTCEELVCISIRSLALIEHCWRSTITTFSSAWIGFLWSARYLSMRDFSSVFCFSTPALCSVRRFSSLLKKASWSSSAAMALFAQWISVAVSSMAARIWMRSFVFLTSASVHHWWRSISSLAWSRSDVISDLIMPDTLSKGPVAVSPFSSWTMVTCCCICMAICMAWEEADCCCCSTGASSETAPASLASWSSELRRAARISSASCVELELDCASVCRKLVASSGTSSTCLPPRSCRSFVRNSMEFMPSRSFAGILMRLISWKRSLFSCSEATAMRLHLSCIICSASWSRTRTRSAMALDRSVSEACLSLSARIGCCSRRLASSFSTSSFLILRRSMSLFSSSLKPFLAFSRALTRADLSAFSTASWWAAPTLAATAAMPSSISESISV
mmetsp:Transcript_3963/g.11466  ORF Transcript_3963/g.11466 Transcript_3963/m.11466 type:complete len:520 (-) Transcript_3963:831-2390(-)